VKVLSFIGSSSIFLYFRTNRLAKTYSVKLKFKYFPLDRGDFYNLVEDLFQKFKEMKKLALY